MSYRTLIVAALVGIVGGAARGDWPQFGGPDRNGISPETGMARAWPAEGPKELWKVSLGVGFGPPAIQGGKVYILDRQDDKQDVLRCLDLQTGKEEWTFAYDAPGNVQYNGSRTTPTVDDKYVFIVGPFGQFHCVDKATHQAVWKKDLIADFGGKRPEWGVAQSPLLIGEAVIVAPQSPTAGVVAYEKATGKLLWQSPAIGAMSYTSPLATKIDGVEQIVMLSKDKVAGVDPNGGRLLWTYDGWKCAITIPCPTPIGDGRFFVTGGYKAGSAMFKVTREGDAFAAATLWDSNKCHSHLHNAILYKDHLYANGSGPYTPKIGMVCLSLDGKLMWDTGKTPGFEMGSLLMAADGLIYAMDGAKGILRLIEASPDGYKQLAEAQILAGKEIWAPMALSDGKLVLRDQTQLKCLQVK